MRFIVKVIVIAFALWLTTLHRLGRDGRAV